MIRSWLRALRRRSQTFIPSAPRQPLSWRPSVEVLEDRRLLDAGTLDPAFGTGGRALADMPLPSNDTASAIAQQSDGKLVVAGTSTTSFGTNFAIVRYNTNGTLDSSFANGGQLITGSNVNNVASVLIQPDNKIVVVGSSGADFTLLRLNPDGSFDSSFDTDGVVSINFDFDPMFSFPSQDAARDATLQSDGKIVVVGSSDLIFSPPITRRVGLARLNGDGSLDTSFDGDGLATNATAFPNGNANAITVDSFGRLVVGGMSRPPASTPNFTVARFSASGSLDLTFNAGVTPGVARTDFDAGLDDAFDVEVVSGKIRLVGQSRIPVGFDVIERLAVARYNDDGTLDTNFDGDGKATRVMDFQFNGGGGFAFTSSGQILMTGTSVLSPGDIVVARANADASADPTFSGDGEVDISLGGFGQVLVVTPTSDGGAAAAGRVFLTDNEDFATVKVTSGGLADTSFNGTGVAILGLTFSSLDQTSGYLAALADGKTLVAGTQLSPFFQGDFALARLNTDGSLDTSFGTGGRVVTDLGSDDRVRAITVQPDGKILVAGTTVPIDLTTSSLAVVRYNADGSLDASFGTGGIATINLSTVDHVIGGAVTAMTLQGDGKIVLVGSAQTDFDFTRDILVARLNTSGSLDTSFGSGGAVITNISNTITPDFPPQSDDAATAVAIDKDDRLVVVGNTLSFDTFIQDLVVLRYNTNGTLHTSFGTGGITQVSFATTENPVVTNGTSVAITENNRIVVGGWTGFFGTRDFLVLQLNPNGLLDPSFGTGGSLTIDFGGDDEGASVILTDKDIVVGGSTADPLTFRRSFALARVTKHGEIDDAFGTDGKSIVSFDGDDVGLSLALALDGKILLGGTSTKSRGTEFAIARFLGDN